MNEARRYALAIAEEIKALDTLLSGASPEEAADALAELELDHLDPRDPYDAVVTWINETVLEMTTYRADKDPDHVRIELLRTCGGPRCEITRDTNDGTAVTVEVWDGSEHYAHRMNPTMLADWLDTIATANN